MWGPLAGRFAFALLALMAGTALTLSSQLASAQKIEDDPVINVPGSDQAMNRAIARARETLPDFLKLMESSKPNQRNFSLKVAISDGKQTEHFWLGAIVRKENDFVGTINNTPRGVKNVKFGQRFPFPAKDISDWMYMQQGKIYGGYTIRVLVNMMPAAEAAKLKAVLAYQPD